MSNPSVSKRERERLRQDRQRDKQSKRKERRTARANRPATENGEDPDIAGIVPGPQPSLEDA
jgi:hypothetical protein